MAALLVAMVGCNKEPQGQGMKSEDKVYMEFKIQTLTTRSSTDNDDDEGYGSSDANPDVEVGKDYENFISKVDVVLRNDDSYVCATVTSPTGSDNNQTWVAEFESSQLSTDTNYFVYIYANCGAKQDIDAVSTAAIDDMTGKNNFWMTNAYTAKSVRFESYSTDKSNPTDLGEHYVERSMARFDYMPKGPYTLGDGVQVTLTEAALINQSKAFYMLRRVSADGTDTGWNVGGAETRANYVVDTDNAAKNNGYQEADAANFDYHLTAAAGWDWRGITTNDLTEADNWEGAADGNTGATGADHELNEYFIWQYTKENTIPGEVANQQNGLSTGVVFKGELSGTKVPEDGAEPIYVFNNILYGTWAQVREAAGTNETLKFYTDKFGDTIDAGENDDLGAAGFTAYKPVDGKYYTYYYYWNRHNDNGDNTAMGRMEFAVVRNNVYKLCVDSIKKFGHPDPTDPDPVDPDPVDPDDPDEQGEYYFKVTVKVLPWVVRVNHIEF